MTSNARPSPFKSCAQMQPHPPVQENTLKSGQVQIERKTIAFMLKENPRGRFLRITENTVGNNGTPNTDSARPGTF